MEPTILRLNAEAKADEKKDEKAVDAKEQDNEEEDTASPTTANPTFGATASPTTESPATSSPTTASPSTEPPSTEPPTTEAPSTASPTEGAQQANEPPTSPPVAVVVEPAVPVTPPPTLTPLIEPSSPQVVQPQTFENDDPSLMTQAATTTQQPTTTNETLPHYVRLEPLYMTVSLTAGDFSEEGFMDVLVDYMEFNMARDIEGFQSITYGISTFSQTNAIVTTSRSANNTATNPDFIVSNITAHVHLLTATFDGKPRQPDLVITQYMEMLLENEELFQQYIDSQPQLDAQIYSTTLEFEETIQPTNVQTDNNANANGVQEEQEESPPKTEEEKASSIWKIVGITMGCFCVLLWVVYLHGIQSRPIST
ncbi:expressed unknown protein [Seminavis robusta]|uniref:Uncharacterized protein n=1 Tax=Seminavis robusta TaxID=568900 RepID=A0A9N8HCC7_9STRA|nr:expressed unknown protein [Seminavis robusta]|eukprot:Sro376_g129700.1 n/a (368) ;mRNA; r:28834-29937